MQVKTLSLISVVFMGLLAGLTCSLHFVILTLGRQPEFARQSWSPLVVSFNWPSVAYALDILGWDVFFALSMLFAAQAFWGSRLAVWIRVLMIASGMLALAGLSGVVVGDMQLRNIGIVGYVGVFIVVAALLAILFYRARPLEAQHSGLPPLYSPSCLERLSGKSYARTNRLTISRVIAT
jgi:hypothetical protein